MPQQRQNPQGEEYGVRKRHLWRQSEGKEAPFPSQQYLKMGNEIAGRNPAEGKDCQGWSPMQRTWDGRIWETLPWPCYLYLSNVPLPQQPMGHTFFPQFSSRCQEPAANTTTSHCHANYISLHLTQTSKRVKSLNWKIHKTRQYSKSNAQVHQDRERG